MKMYKIIFKSKTAFFRNDVTSTSYQESFNCPPLSTIYGMIAAAYGEYRYDVDMGYVFEYEAKCVDYELTLSKLNENNKNYFKYKRIYEKYINDDRFDRNDILRGCMGTQPIKREILFNCTLTLYISKKEIAESFLNPYYSLLLGRSEDLVKIACKPREIELIDTEQPFNFGKTIIPFKIGKWIPGRLSKLNIEIFDEFPRKIKRTDIYNIVDKVWTNQKFYEYVKIDPELNLGIYIHKGKSEKASI